MLGGIASNILIGIVLFWSVLTIIVLMGKATDDERPRFPDKVEERWWEK